MKRKTFEVSVLFIREGEYWVAQCLEFDIAAQGLTIAEAKNAFELTFVSQIIVDLHHNEEPLAKIPHAPAAYWQRFKKAERLDDRIQLYVPENVPPAYIIDAVANDLRVA